MDNKNIGAETTQTVVPYLPKKTMQFSRRRRRGLSPLVEGVLYLVVAVVGLYLVYQMFTGIKGTLNRMAFQSQLVRAVSIIESAHSYSGIYPSDSLLPHLVGEGFPGNQLSEADNGVLQFFSPYKTRITILGSSSNYFRVAATDLPSAACRAAALAFEGSTSGLTGLQINTGSVDLPLDSDSVRHVSHLCAHDENYVELRF